MSGAGGKAVGVGKGVAVGSGFVRGVGWEVDSPGPVGGSIGVSVGVGLGAGVGVDWTQATSANAIKLRMKSQPGNIRIDLPPDFRPRHFGTPTEIFSIVR